MVLESRRSILVTASSFGYDTFKQHQADFDFRGYRADSNGQGKPSIVNNRLAFQASTVVRSVPETFSSFESDAVPCRALPFSTAFTFLIMPSGTASTCAQTNSSAGGAAQGDSGSDDSDGGPGTARACVGGGLTFFVSTSKGIGSYGDWMGWGIVSAPIDAQSTFEAGSGSSFAVEFDPHQDSEFGDPSHSHVGYNEAFVMTSRATADLADASVGIDVADGARKNVWIDYSGTTLEVRVSATSDRPAQAVLQVDDLDMCEVLGGAAQAYVGFSGGTTDQRVVQSVYSWQWATYSAGAAGCYA
eukprot:jgi/Mesen1/372/ME000010S_10830